DRLVLEGAERGPGYGEIRAGWIAFPNASRSVFLAREPRAPWGGSSGAVDVGAGADRVRVDDRAVATETDRADAARNALAVGRVDPAAADAERRAAVGEIVPDVRSAGDDLPRARNHPRGEADRQ